LAALGRALALHDCDISRIEEASPHTRRALLARGGRSRSRTPWG